MGRLASPRMGRKPKKAKADPRVTLWRGELAKRVLRMQGTRTVKEFLSDTGLTRAMYYVIIGGARDYNMEALLRALSKGRDPVTEIIASIDQSMSVDRATKDACWTVAEAYADRERRPLAEKLIDAIATQGRKDSRPASGGT